MRVVVEWKEYRNFFELRRAHMRGTRLLYAIGDAPFCYIGSIGSDKGQQGIGIRYQAQYLKLAKAVFGLPEEFAKRCYAGTILEPLDTKPEEILAIEGELQQLFIEKYGQESALFEPIGRRGRIDLINQGAVPGFLQDSADKVRG